MQQTLEIAGIEVFIDGPEHSDDPDAACIAMLHGWPDTARLWGTSAPALATRSRCVRFTWPGFGPATAGKRSAAPSLDGEVGQ